MKNFFTRLTIAVAFCIIILAPITHDPCTEFSDQSKFNAINSATPEQSLRANNAYLTDSYFGYEFWSYGRLKGGTVQENLEAIECYDYVADYTNALYVEQGQRSTSFGFTISGWSSTTAIPQYSTITGIRLTIGVWTKSLTQSTNGISDVRAKISLYKPSADNKLYETLIVAGQTQIRLYTSIILFNSSQLIADLNSGYNIHWIEISAFTTYIAWNRDALYLDQLLVDYIYQPPTAPSAPALTRTSAEFEPSVQLAWNQPSSNAPITQYRVYRNGTLLATTTATAYTDSSPKSYGQQFYYTVTAVSTIGESPHSNAVHLFVCTLPDSPQFSLAQNHSGITISWNTPNNGGATITEYRIYRSVNGSSFTLLRTLASANYIDTDLVPNSNYSYRVTAVNARGESASEQRSIQSVPWSVALNILSPSWISNYVRYTTADSITIAIDVQSDYYNTTTARITAIVLNGTIVQPAYHNSTRLTIRIPLPAFGFRFFIFEIWAYGQSIIQSLEITRTDSIRGAVQLIPEPIQFESITIIPTKSLKLILVANNQYSNIRRDSSYIRLQRNQYQINLLNQLLDQSGTINSELDLSSYLDASGKLAISVYLAFSDGTYLMDYREIWVDSEAPIINNVVFNENLSVLEFQISEEFPSALKLVLSADGLVPTELILNTRAQFGLYSGFNQFRYLVEINSTLLDQYKNAKNGKLTIICIDAANRTTTQIIPIADPNYSEPLAVISEPLALLISAAIAIGAGAVWLKQRTSDRRVHAALDTVTQRSGELRSAAETLQNAIQSTGIDAVNQVHATRANEIRANEQAPVPAPAHVPAPAPPINLRFTDAEILEQQPEKFSGFDYLMTAYFMVKTVPLQRVEEIYKRALQIGVEKQLPANKFWLFFVKCVLKEEMKMSAKMGAKMGGGAQQ